VLRTNVVCRGLLRVEMFGTGRIEIGAGTYIGDDCLLSAAREIVVGPNVLIAHGVQLFDNDSHPIELAARQRDFAAIFDGGQREEIAAGPIRIGAGVWIGFNATILKGVTIGEGAVVAACSVVSRDVPAHAVVAGNPATVVNTLNAP
jgi:acetyltransferase-like isoleucine patch superfamily enzyme